MHSIDVEDPWFGPYLKVILPGYAPTFWVGPLFKRTIIREYLVNYGTVARTGSVREKNCEHSYVSGLVTGVPSSAENPQGRIVLSSRGGSFESIMWYSHTYDSYRKYTVSFTVTTSPGDKYATMHCSCNLYYKHYPWETPLITTDHGEFTIRVPVLYDTYARTTTFTTINVSSVPGATGILKGSTVADSACPYSGGTGVDNGLGSFNAISYWVDKTLSEMPAPSMAQRGRARSGAIVKAIEDLSLANINWLTDLHDFASPISTAASIGSHFKIHTEPREMLKSLANLHLLWKYVIKTNISTARQIEKLESFLTRDISNILNRVMSDAIGHGTETITVSGKGGTSLVTSTAKAVFESGWSPFATVSWLQTRGLLPNVSDLWDIIPYSFVVDWCIPVQDSLEAAEALTATLQMDLRHIVLGEKIVQGVTKTWQAGTHKFQISLSRTTYERVVSHTLPPCMGLGKLTLGDPRKHALTGSALVIQRLL